MYVFCTTLFAVVYHTSSSTVVPRCVVIIPYTFVFWLHLAVFGEGLSGKATYSFELVFCEPVSTEVRAENLIQYSCCRESD